MYLKTNRHTGAKRLLNLEGLLGSLKDEGAAEKEITKCKAIIEKNGFVEKGHYWYRRSRSSDVVREGITTMILDNDRFLNRLTVQAAKELQIFGVVLGGQIDGD